MRDALQKAQPPTRQDPRSKTQIQDGGTLETFTIEGVRITGELVFDRNHVRDGLRLEMPLSLWVRLTPARLARQVAQWRGWMLDALYEEIPAVTRKRLESERENLDDQWVDALGENPEGAPLLLLLDVFRQLPGTAELALNLQPQKDTHLRLHLDLLDALSGRRTSFDLSPEWGSAQVFLQGRAVFFPMRKEVPEAPICPHHWAVAHSVVYGFGVARAATNVNRVGYGLLDAVSATWWEERLRKWPAEPWQGPICEVLQDRLSVLELLGARPMEDWLPLERNLQMACLLGTGTAAWDGKALNQRLDRFTGLEGLQGRKVGSFGDLGKSVSDETELVRLALVRNAHDAALLGVEALVHAWGQLRECTLRIRKQQKLEARWHQLKDLQEDCSDLAERIALAAASTLGATPGPWELYSLEDFREWLTLRVEERDGQLRRWKTLRERFRPWLAGNQISLAKRNELRATLQKLESGQASFEDGGLEELELEALENELRWNNLRKVQTGEDEEETVTLDDLQKLKAKFRNR